MKKAILCMLLLSCAALAEVDKAQLDLFKKEAATLEADIDNVMSSTIPSRGMAESTKATYLEGYGAVFTLEASLAPTQSPFSRVKTPAEVRSTVVERRKDIETKLSSLLKDRVATMRSVASTEAVTVIVHLFNANPVDVPDLPSQIVFTVKKQNQTEVVRSYQ